MRSPTVIVADRKKTSDACASCHRLCTPRDDAADRRASADDQSGADPDLAELLELGVGDDGGVARGFCRGRSVESLMGSGAVVEVAVAVELGLQVGQGGGSGLAP